MSSSAPSAATLTLRPAVATDIPYLTPLYLRSFSDPLSLRCFPRNASTTAFWTTQNHGEFSEATSHFLVLVDPALPEATSASDMGPIVAYAKWNSPLLSASGELVAGGGDDPDAMPDWPAGGDAELANEFFGHLAQRRKAIMGHRPHWYLEIVATLPEYRGRGLAGRLIDWGVQRADEMGLECYLEAGPGLVGFYGRWGFVIEESFEPMALKGHTECLMKRPSKREREGRGAEGGKW
jgi:GNAT superfamily N-acetyltransferase